MQITSEQMWVKKTEFDEHLIELIVLIPLSQPKLLDQPKGHTLKHAMTEVRKFKASGTHTKQIKEMNAMSTSVATYETQVSAIDLSV